MAIEKLQAALKRHEAVRSDVNDASVQLHTLRMRAARNVVLDVEEYVNLLANSPKEFDTSGAEFRIVANRFRETVNRIEAQAARSVRTGSATGVAGATAGLGVAALGPSAAMAVATTFGTASTGTPISALSGAAATKAALAWLGGGALAAGGSGMAGGSAVLALMGPIGWTVGGLAIAGSGLYLNSRNKKHAEKATKEAVKIEAQIRSLRAALDEIRHIESSTTRHISGCQRMLDLLATAPADYHDFSDGQKKRLAALINHIRSLSELLSLQVKL